MYATNFLQGRTAYTPGIILECWWRSSDGRAPGALAQEFPMYSTTPVYTKIKPARSALTTFVAQMVELRGTPAPTCSGFSLLRILCLSRRHGL